MPSQDMDSWNVQLQVISNRVELADIHFPWYRRENEEAIWRGDIFNPDPVIRRCRCRSRTSDSSCRCSSARSATESGG